VEHRSIDEAISRHYGYQNANERTFYGEQCSSDSIKPLYEPTSVKTTWFVALLSQQNPVFGRALVRERPVTLDEKLVIQAMPEVHQVTKYEPRHFSKPTLVNVKVFEKIGRVWRKRNYWRLAGLIDVGRYDVIRCDGPNLPMKSTYVPANYRRAKKLDIGRKERANDTVGQQKRYRIASVPMAIRYAKAVMLRKRLDAQAEKAFHNGNIARHDTLDARANAVSQWLVHVAETFPDLAFKRPDAEPNTDKQKIAVAKRMADKNANILGSHISRSDKLASRKLREARLERQAKWKSRKVNYR